jgi:hypothetical protein
VAVSEAAFENLWSVHDDGMGSVESSPDPHVRSSLRSPGRGEDRDFVVLQLSSARFAQDLCSRPDCEMKLPCPRGDDAIVASFAQGGQILAQTSRYVSSGCTRGVLSPSGVFRAFTSEGSRLHENLANRTETNIQVTESVIHILELGTGI